MNPLKLLRKLIRILRGGAAPAEVFLAVALGIVTGFVPGFNFSLILLLLILLLLNANVAVFLFFLAAAKLVSLPLTPVSFGLGKALLAIPPIRGLVRTLVNAPVTALMDLESYTLLGSLVIGAIIGVILGIIFARAIGLFRRKMAALEEGSEAFKRITGNLFVRIALRFLLGKRKAGRKTYLELLDQRARILRRRGIILAVVILLLALIPTFILGDYALKRGLEAGLTSANGATVDVASASLSILGGRLALAGMEFCDPEQLDRNRVEIGELTADISVPNLLRRRVVIDEAVLGALKTDTTRSQPGARVEKPTPEPPAPEPEPEALGPADLPLGELFARREEILARLRQLRTVLIHVKNTAARLKKDKGEPSQMEIAARGYRNIKAEYLLDKHPQLLVRRLAVKSLPLSIEGKEHLVSIEAKGLSSNPRTAPQDPSLDIRSEELPLSAGLTLSFKDPSVPHKLQFAAEKLDVSRLQNLLSEKSRVRFEQGAARAEGSGSLSSDYIDLSINVQIDDLKLGLAGSKGILGLDAETSRAALDSISSLNTTFRLRGPLTSPVITLDHGQLLANFKDALLEAGKKELTNRVQRELDKAISEKLGEKLPGLKAEELLEGILGGEKKQEQPQEEEEKPEAPKDKLPGLIKDLLK